MPGLDVEIKQLMEDMIGDLTGDPQPIVIEFYSDTDNANELDALAPRVTEALKKVRGAVDVASGLVVAGDALEIQIDRVQAQLEGLDAEAVTRMVSGYLSGAVTTQIQRGPRMAGVRVWVPHEFRDRQEDILKLQLRAPDGHMLPLSRIAALRHITGQPQIMRSNLKRMITVTGRIAGRDMGSTIRDVRAMLDQPGMVPGDVYYHLGGLYQQQQIAFQGQLVVLAAAVVLVFLLLLFLYERFLVAIAMLLTTLLSSAAVFIGLWLTGTELNITSLMGLTMVVGIVTEVDIFYFSEYQELPGELPRKQRTVDAGINRMRPSP